jgi:dihydroorotase
MKYDLLIRHGHVIDPSQGIDAVADIGICQGKIAAIVPAQSNGIDPTLAKQVIDATEQLVIPGLIDTHAHVFEYVTGRFGLEADLCGVHSGVTTLIDQGGPSCITLPAFRAHVVNAKKSRVVAFLSAYLVGGLEGHYYPSLYKPDCLDVDATVKAAVENPDIVKGFKAHAELGGFARWGIEVMRLSAQIAQQAGLPLYIHFGQLWPLPQTGANGVDPDTILEQVVKLLKPGDILAHPFTRHPGGFVNREGKVHPIVREALAMGLKVDVGHGSHFSFRMAQIALQAGIIPHTLGADMHGYNTQVPRPAGTPETHPDTEHMFFGQTRFSLVSAMTAMLALGLSLDHVIRMATINSAQMAGLGEGAGTLKIGAQADISVLHDDRGRWVLTDNEGTQIVTDRLLRPAYAIRQGVRYEADASILPPMRTAA